MILPNKDLDGLQLSRSNLYRHTVLDALLVNNLEVLQLICPIIILLHLHVKYPVILWISEVEEDFLRVLIMLCG